MSIKARNLDPVLQQAIGIADGIAQAKAYREYEADGAANMEYLKHFLNGASTTIDITSFKPKYIGQLLIIVCTDSTNDCTAKCASGVTWDGSNNMATFADAMDSLVCIATSLTRWLILVNLGSVALSTV